MATIAQLDNDCLRAIFLRVPLKDFIKNVQRVSSQFRTGAQTAFSEKFERDPIEFKFIGNCSHCVFHGWSDAGPPRISLAKFPIPLSKLTEVPNSNLLPYVSKICLGDAFFEELSDLIPQLKAIMEKISAASDIRFVLSADDHYGKSSSRHAVRLLSRGPLREGAFMCANVLRNAKSFHLDAPVLESRYSRGDKMDFLQLLHFTEQLTSLYVPASIFAFTAPHVKRILAHLESLEITSDYNKIKRSCQDVIAMVCDSCPKLTKFEYNCEYGPCICGGRCGCVFDLNPLTQLTNLRSLTLSLAKPKFLLNEYPIIGQLPLVEFLKLKLSCKVPEFCAILRMFPNVKELHFLERCAVPLLYEELQAMLISGQLGQLRAVRISTDKSPLFGYNFADMHLLTEIESAVSLRRLDLHDCGYSIFLGTPPVRSAGEVRFNIRPARSDVPQFVRQAKNVTQLLFNVVWMSDGYEALVDILVAMQEGSLQQLTMRARWKGIKRRRLEALVLLAGCRVQKWMLKENRTKNGAGANEDGKNNDMNLGFILIRGHKIKAEGEKACQFSVRLIEGYLQ